jgi:hypothetical protein
MKFLSQHSGAMLLTMERARGFEFARVGGWSGSRVEGMGRWVGG